MTIAHDTASKRRSVARNVKLERRRRVCGLSLWKLLKTHRYNEDDAPPGKPPPPLSLLRVGCWEVEVGVSVEETDGVDVVSDIVGNDNEVGR